MEAQKNKKPVRSVLGRGLNALISHPPVSVREVADQNTALEIDRLQVAHTTNEGSRVPAASDVDKRVAFVPISSVVSNPKQPRREFDQLELQELAESIKALGIIQPVLVRRSPVHNGETYEIIAGERRWRAAQLANLQQLPVIIHDVDDKGTLEIALVENIQRSDLNPVEEAAAYQRLMDEFSLSQAEVAERVGKDRATVANLVRLLKLPEQVISLLKEGKISIGHAKAILTIREPGAQISLAKKTLNEGLSVRALEAIVSRVVVLDSGRPKTPASTDSKKLVGETRRPHSGPIIEAIDRMRNSLGTKVNLSHHPSGRGKIEIEYFSEQELDRIVEHICR